MELDVGLSSPNLALLELVRECHGKKKEKKIILDYLI